MYMLTYVCPILYKPDATAFGGPCCWIQQHPPESCLQEQALVFICLFTYVYTRVHSAVLAIHDITLTYALSSGGDARLLNTWSKHW